MSNQSMSNQNISNQNMSNQNSHNNNETVSNSKEYDPYQILGIPENSDIIEIKKSYKELCMVHHPDKGGNEELFSIINKAYRTIIMRFNAVKPKVK